MPLWDTNIKTGGLTIFEKSHNKGYFDHKLEDPTGIKKWTHKYTNIDKKIYSKFNRKTLKLKLDLLYLLILHLFIVDIH